jgi:hypothetical protein
MATERCTICAEHAWEVDNEYLANGSARALELCSSLGISKSAFYRHAKQHLQLRPGRPPEEPNALEWARAATNLAAAVESHKLIKDPAKVLNIAILVGSDEGGQFVELAMVHQEGAVDRHAVEAMAFDLGLETESRELVGGLNPTIRTSAKLHAPEIFVGRRNVKR